MMRYFFQKKNLSDFKRFSMKEDIDYFLKKLMPLPELEGYWIEKFLLKVSSDHARLGAEFS